MAEEISIERQQLRMLVEAIRKIVTNPRTPKWVANPLETAVREAKAIKPSETKVVQKTAPEEPIEPEEIALEVGCLCVDDLESSDTCQYLIIREGLVIDGIQLFDVRVVKGDKKTPKGTVMHNVPSTYLRAVRRPQAPQAAHEQVP
mgnify:FL=1